MGNNRRKVAAIILAMILAASTVWAAALVTSKAVIETMPLNQDVSFILDVDSATSVAGVNGEMRYDATLFSNPRAAPGSGASGFTVAGNELEPGRFRFVAYKSPTASVDLAKPALLFTLKVGNHASPTRSTKVTYFISAAAKPDGASYGSSVAFANVTLNFKTGVQVWTYY